MKQFFFSLLAVVAVFAGTVSCREKIDTEGFVGIRTEPAEDITANSARLVGTREMDGESSPVVGFVYDKAGSLKKDSSPRETGGVIPDGSFWITVYNLSDDTEYEFMAFTTVDGKDYFGSKRSFKTLRSIPSDAVDMGTGIYWAKCNLGATEPYQAGNFYAWGETVPSPPYSDNSYALADPVNGGYQRYNKSDGLTRLKAADDAATQTLGGYWRMPTREEFEKLMENCSIKATTLSGRNVWQFTSKVNGNTLFFPSSGYTSVNTSIDPNCAYMWTASRVEDTGYISFGHALVCHTSGICNSIHKGKTHIQQLGRSLGLPVRPVCE